jgi:hypothetical protein
MKAIVFSSISLLLTVSLVSANSVFVARLVDDTVAELEKADGAEDYARVYRAYAKRERFFAISVDHAILRETDGIFAELTATDAYGDETDVIKSRLIDSLNQIKRLSLIGIDSVL